MLFVLFCFGGRHRDSLPQLARRRPSSLARAPAVLSLLNHDPRRAQCCLYGLILFLTKSPRPHTFLRTLKAKTSLSPVDGQQQEGERERRDRGEEARRRRAMADGTWWCTPAPGARPCCARQRRAHQSLGNPNKVCGRCPYARLLRGGRGGGGAARSKRERPRATPLWRRARSPRPSSPARYPSMLSSTRVTGSPWPTTTTNKP